MSRRFGEGDRWRRRRLKLNPPHSNRCEAGAAAGMCERARFERKIGFMKIVWRVYKDLKRYEQGVRDRAVWSDGRLKEKF